MLWYLILLLLISLAAVFAPLLLKKTDENISNFLLGFSGSFLLGITLLHLLPETFAELKEKAGIYIFIGFFVQLFLQKFSHGAEHGHVHVHEGQKLPVNAILWGLAIHAFLEGIPLGFNFQNPDTNMSLFLGVAAHKIPEAFTVGSILLYSQSKKKNVYALNFAFISPIAGLLAMLYGQKFYFISNLLVYIVPIVIGSFIHVSTTILFESGTRHHQMSQQKITAIALGALLAGLTLLFHVH